jgi:D-alanyl-D-alanine carboxypeptidase (penicillin-binding protein 5/6)
VKRIVLLFGVLVVLSATAANASVRPSEDAPIPNAAAWYVVNADTGEVVVSHDAQRRLPIASITKLMTVVVALAHHSLNDVVTVDSRAARVGEETINLQPHEQLTVRDLVKGALIQSANDAADALALSVAPSFPAFAALMNHEASVLGLKDSHFVRPDGLDADDEWSSARDVTLLAEAAMKLAPVREAVASETATIPGGRTLHTWNDLLGVVPGVIGVKTGHTNAAGWCQVVDVERQGVTLYVTILGSPSRAQRNRDLQSLAEFGVAQYRTVDAVSTSRAYASVSLPYGLSPIHLVAARPFTVVTRLGTQLVEKVVAPAGVVPPIAKGQPLGTVQIYSAGTLVATRPLVADRAVGAPTLRTRVEWYTHRTADRLVGIFG